MVDPDHVITRQSVIVNYEKDSHSFLAQSVFHILKRVHQNIITSHLPVIITRLNQIHQPGTES